MYPVIMSQFYYNRNYTLIIPCCFVVCRTTKITHTSLWPCRCGSAASHTTTSISYAFDWGAEVKAVLSSPCFRALG